jgi:UDP-3-O-[3-hydroxymyristoyl] glucosamine N-acyltransferase
MPTLGELVAALGGTLVGDASTTIERIAPLATADRHAITFLANPRLRAQLDATQAACVIVAPSMLAAVVGRAAITTDDPYAYYAALTQWWAKRVRPAVPAGVHSTATVHPSAVVHASASVGANAVVDEGAQVGAHAVIGALTYVGSHAIVGEHTQLAARVVLGERCSIGARGIVHAGAVIGADGFGFAPVGPTGAKRYSKIEQLGAVRIGDDVEIGANTCIDRGALGDTVIEDGVKLDNLIQIGHNVRIGAHTAIAGCTGVAGSTTIGAFCAIAGSANIIGHLTIADGVSVSVATVVTRSIHKAGHYSGSFPFDDNAAWEKNAATLRNLHALRDRVRALEKLAPSGPTQNIRPQANEEEAP